MVLIVAATWLINHDSDPPLPELRALSLPDPSTSDDDMLSWAETLLAGRCMVQQGFAFVVDWPNDQKIPQIGQYGFDDIAIAQRYGYGIGALVRAKQRPGGADPNTPLISALTPAERDRYSLAMFGPPNDLARVPQRDGTVIGASRSGCLADARRQLYGDDLQRWYELDTAATARAEALNTKLIASPQYTAALTKWRACMTAAGHGADNPVAARDHVGAAYQRSNLDRAWTIEQQTAVADATCERSSALVATAQEVHTSLVAAMGPPSADSVDYERRRGDAVARANQLRADLLAAR